MKFETRDEKISNNYRRIEAMYRNNYSSQDIARVTGLELIDVIRVEQTIFGRDQMAKEKQQRGAC